MYFCTLADGIKKIEHAKAQEYGSILNGVATQRTTPSSYMAHNERIKTATSYLEDGDVAVLEFLHLVSHSVDNIMDVPIRDDVLDHEEIADPPLNQNLVTAAIPDDDLLPILRGRGVEGRGSRARGGGRGRGGRGRGGGGEGGRRRGDGGEGGLVVEEEAEEEELRLEEEVQLLMSHQWLVSNYYFVYCILYLFNP